jgi:6-phosphogluconolactonase/glucosamine-6-phosphate isomerase/deaminase
MVAMKLEVFADPDSTAKAAAATVAAEASAAIAARGSFVMALSGGHTPSLILRALAHEEVPWEAVQLVQVDERPFRSAGSQECFQQRAWEYFSHALAIVLHNLLISLKDPQRASNESALDTFHSRQNLGKAKTV